MGHAAILMVVVALLVSVSAHGYFAGGGKDAAKGNDCLIGYEGIDAGDVTLDGKKQVLSCTDCDPTCDHDGNSTANGSCTFQVGVCINQSGVEGCIAPSALDKASATAKVNGAKIPAEQLRLTAPPLEGSVCWPSVGVGVPIKGKKGAGRATLRLTALVKKNKAEGIPKTRKDTDTLTYVCVPRLAGDPCPVSTTSSTTTTTISSATSTTLTSGCFQDWGDGTIRDVCTNLQWEKKDGSDGILDATNLHDVDNVYSWAGQCTVGGALCQPDATAAATCLALSDGGTTGCSTCGSGTCNVDPRGYGAITTVWDWLNQVNGANFAGHNDWRLPSENGCNSCWSGVLFSCSSCNPHELETILLAPYPCGTSSPCIDPIFGPTAVCYWSASTDAADPGNAWIVAYSALLAYAKSVPVVYPFEFINVRAVR